MGTPAGAARSEAAAGATGFSPDVLHNRQWLRALMARHQFDNLPDAWWHFAQGVCRRRRLQTPISPHGEVRLCPWGT